MLSGRKAIVEVLQSEIVLQVYVVVIIHPSFFDDSVKAQYCFLMTLRLNLDIARIETAKTAL